MFDVCSGNARLNEYETAIKFLDAILLVQPGNHQAKNLNEEITRRMTREGCMSAEFRTQKKLSLVSLDVGMGVAVGAGALVLGGKPCSPTSPRNTVFSSRSYRCGYRPA